MIAIVRSKKFPFNTKFPLPPINLPLLVSFAFHGLFFTAILPNLTLDSNDLDNINSLSDTPVIELNTIEQTRLPDLSPQEFFNWNGMTPLPNDYNSSIPNEIPLPQTNNFPDSSINPNFQFPLINNSNNAIANLPPPPSFSPTPIYIPNYSVDVNLPQPTNLPPPPPLNANAFNDLPPNLDSVGNVIDIEAESEDKSAIREKLFPHESNPKPPNPRDLINSKLTPNINQSPSNLSPNNQNSQPPQSTVAMTSPTIQPSYEKLNEVLTKEDKNTSNEEANKNDVAWRASVKIVKPVTMNVVGIYPRDACIRQLEGTTTYGVTVNPLGKVINTQLLKSSGYPLFNNQALRQIQGRTFNNDTGVTQAYHIYVDFKYDPKICPSLSLSNLGNIPPQQPPVKAPVVETPAPKNPNSDVNQPNKIVNPPLNNNTNEVEIKTHENKQPSAIIIPSQPDSNPTKLPMKEKTPTPSTSKIDTPLVPIKPQPQENSEIKPVVEKVAKPLSKPLTSVEKPSPSISPSNNNNNLDPIKPLPPLEPLPDSDKPENN